MRDLFVLSVILISIPFIFRYPYVGILTWSWIGYMNPHKLAYGFAQTFPFAMVIAIVTMLAMLFSKEAKKIPWTRESIVLLIFILWMLITTVDAFYPKYAWMQFEKVFKIELVIFFTLVLMINRRRIEQLIWVIVLSLGFYGIKGGIFTLTTGGGYNVMGPYGSFIGGNNEIGLALIMTVPLMRYLQLRTKKHWLQLGWYGAMGLTVIAILGTQSRGALLGLVAMSLFLILKSRKKVILLPMMALIIPLTLTIMPESWFDRMHTIETYEDDRSAQGRMHAWRYAYDVAIDYPLGGGFEAFLGRTEAHSIYFEILGEHGFVGLGIFLLLLLYTWRSGKWLMRVSKKREEIAWVGDLASMVQVSLVGYAISGAFLGLAYFDLYYHLIALIVVCKVIVINELEKEEKKDIVEQKYYKEKPDVYGQYPPSHRSSY